MCPPLGLCVPSRGAAAREMRIWLLSDRADGGVLQPKSGNGRPARVGPVFGYSKPVWTPHGIQPVANPSDHRVIRKKTTRDLEA
jgi:hypothetical protein